MNNLSRKANYALRALYALARRADTRPVRAADLAEQERIPAKFLESILLQLKNAGLLDSRRGKGGGYVLSIPANQIVVGQIIRLIDGPLAPVPCLNDGAFRCEGCRDRESCSTRRVMTKVACAVAEILDGTTIDEAASER